MPVPSVMEQPCSRQKDDPDIPSFGARPAQPHRLPQQRSSWWNPPPAMPVPISPSASRPGARSASPPPGCTSHPGRPLPAADCGVNLASSDEESGMEDGFEDVLLTSREVDQPEDSPMRQASSPVPVLLNGSSRGPVSSSLPPSPPSSPPMPPPTAVPQTMPPQLPQAPSSPQALATSSSFTPAPAAAGDVAVVGIP